MKKIVLLQTIMTEKSEYQKIASGANVYGALKNIRNLNLTIQYDKMTTLTIQKNKNKKQNTTITRKIQRINAYTN